MSMKSKIQNLPRSILPLLGPAILFALVLICIGLVEAQEDSDSRMLKDLISACKEVGGKMVNGGCLK